MSHSSYARMWAAAHGALEDLLLDEFPATAPRPQKDAFQIFQGLATFYLKYLRIFRSLEAVYDQLVHPQKRRVVRHVLDGVMGRLLELRNEMVELEMSEFHYFDDVLQDLKMTPEDLEIPIPRYFLREKMHVLKERQRMLAHILAKGGLIEQEPVFIQTMHLEEAVRILQVCERARQGRLRAQFMKEIRQAEREGLGKRRPPSALNPEQAATRIQKVWRGHSQRKRTKRERLEEMIFLGMLPAESSKPSAAHLRAQRVEAHRQLVQEQNESEYQQALLSVKKSVQVAEGPDIRETLQEQIRQWFLECRDATGKFPDFPSTEDGGSASIFAEKTPEQVAAELAAKEEEKEKRRKSKGKKDKKGGKDGKEKKKDKRGKSKGKKGKGEPEEEEKGWTMPPSSFLPTVKEGAKIYREVWRGRDESQNFLQRFDAELVREEKRLEVEEEVRVQVDELMRHELRNLKLVVDRDKGKKKKKAKKGSKKKKKKSKKSSKKKKKKKEKDLTADRTIESLYEELILEGFIIQPMNVKLSDYIGEYSYLGTTLRQADIEPMPSLSDVRQLIALHGVLPLGSQAVREKAPVVNSLLLAGPAGVGKKMLVHALCAETGANLFNLSPGNLTGRYPGRGGLQYLLHMVLKVARQLQPSVIWIRDAEKTFYKKVPRTEREMEPKRLKKDLARALKSLRPEDRVLLVGTSRRPFDAELKPFCKVYKKIILIPRPDYASRLVLWRELLRGGGAEPPPGLDLSSLAKVTDGYTQGHIQQAVRAVLHPRRLTQLAAKPLSASEFVGPLARLDPVFREEEDAFKVWYSKTPLGKRKARATKSLEDKAEEGKRKSKDTRKSKDDKSKVKKKKTKKKK
ncbi:dynein regulatory complex protein 11 isoform X2 [Myripristis murdjan]|uniref:dynein regulatory complex protein 11 isoform X2 n=1 Tax=Myripristis murdjan TaxID=586833 RepID=UPI001176282F|nr:dynein regulatory complex protein 11 isoform X2 [Myripristis murdjan]